MDKRSVALTITASMPYEFLLEFLQLIRRFEKKDETHDREVLLSYRIDAPEVAATEVAALLEKIEPPFAMGPTVIPFLPRKH